jgi:hypothetical protein
MCALLGRTKPERFAKRSARDVVVGQKRAFQPGEGLVAFTNPSLTSAKANGET